MSVLLLLVHRSDKRLATKIICWIFDSLSTVPPHHMLNETSLADLPCPQHYDIVFELWPHLCYQLLHSLLFTLCQHFSILALFRVHAWPWFGQSAHQLLTKHSCIKRLCLCLTWLWHIWAISFRLVQDSLVQICLALENGAIRLGIQILQRRENVVWLPVTFLLRFNDCGKLARACVLVDSLLLYCTPDALDSSVTMRAWKCLLPRHWASHGCFAEYHGGRCVRLIRCFLRSLKHWSAVQLEIGTHCALWRISSEVFIVWLLCCSTV